MISKTRVLTSTNHEVPDRVPVFLIGMDSKNVEAFSQSLGLSTSEEIMDYLEIDVRSIRPIYSQEKIVESLGPDFANIKTVAGKPDTFGLPNLKSLSDTLIRRPFADATSRREIEQYPYWPDPKDFDYECVNRFADRTGNRYALSRGFMPLLAAYLELTGMEQGLVKLHTTPQVAHAILDRLTELYVEHLKTMIDVSEHCLDFAPLGDDFATQGGLMISPTHWREFLRPRYARMFEVAKSKGKKVWFHACGTFRDVLPDLVDIGMDVWETVQLHLKGNDPYELKREFGHYITFAGGINTQRTLPFGTPEEVREEVRRVVGILGQSGGYICGPDHTIMAEVPLENVLALYDEARSYRGEGITL